MPPTILPARRVRRRVVSQIAYRSDTEAGGLQLVQAPTEVIVASGQPVPIAASTTGHEVVRRFLLGSEHANRARQVTLVLTAEIP